MHYRTAMDQDQDQLLTLVKKFASSFEIDAHSFETSFSRLIKDENVDLIVAESESDLKGYVLVFHHLTFFANGPVSWVEELFVEDECRKQGIGRRLMEIAEKKAKERNSRLIALATRRAEAFYKAIGYEASATYFRKFP